MSSPNSIGFLSHIIDGEFSVCVLKYPFPCPLHDLICAGKYIVRTFRIVLKIEHRSGIAVHIHDDPVFAVSVPYSVSVPAGKILPLIPLAASNESRLVLPVAYGIGTALPVVVFAFLIAFGSTYVGKAFQRLTAVERWIRIAAGIVFIVAGIYLSLTYVYGLPILG